MTFRAVITIIAFPLEYACRKKSVKTKQHFYAACLTPSLFSLYVNISDCWNQEPLQNCFRAGQRNISGRFQKRIGLGKGSWSIQEVVHGFINFSDDLGRRRHLSCLRVLDQDLSRPFPPLNWSTVGVEKRTKPIIFKILATQAKSSKCVSLLEFKVFVMY